MAVVPAQAASPVTGRWLTVEKDSVVEIGACGNAVCGRIARILKPTDDGKPAIDKYNPDPALRARPIEGLVILSGFTPSGSVWNGRIYDPRSGKSYKSKLARNPDGTLKVQGCIAFLCQTQTWTAAR
ncbi:MAG: DUF2147 domain-containing protein [Sphingomonadaceae bacterium]